MKYLKLLSSYSLLGIALLLAVAATGCSSSSGKQTAPEMTGFSEPPMEVKYSAQLKDSAKYTK
jgi:hypothetical protein